VSKPQSGNSVLISVGSVGFLAREEIPAKHLFGLNRARRSLAKASLSRVFQLRDQTPRGGLETLFSKPRGYPFKTKAAVPIRSGLQFYEDLALGRILQIYLLKIHSVAM
jgi:hypothetical protein